MIDEMAKTLKADVYVDGYPIKKIIDYYRQLVQASSEKEGK